MVIDKPSEDTYTKGNYLLLTTQILYSIKVIYPERLKGLCPFNSNSPQSKGEEVYYGGD